MFSQDDFDKIEKLKDIVPDGIMDASDFCEDLELITNLIAQHEENNFESRVSIMMKVVNNLYEEDGTTLDADKIYSTVISLLFHIHTLLEGMYDEDKQEYFETIKSEVLPSLREDVKTMPYWEDGDAE
jgi:hypothetical protein